MMVQIQYPIVVAAMLGAALVAGVFFGFSNFVMKALGHVPPVTGVRAMQSINVDVVNRWFLGAFAGTALLSITIAVTTLMEFTRPGACYFLAGAFSYVVGTFLITISRNVPLNDRLATLREEDPTLLEQWTRYRRQWTRWNHVRTAAALGATLLFFAGLECGTAVR